MKKNDIFAPICKIWEEFISSYHENYKPGSYVTVDEQLLWFRGRCPYKIYISSKPSNCGLKIVMVCDIGKSI